MSNGKSAHLIRTSIHTHIFHLGLYHKLNHMKKTICFHLRKIHTNMKITKPFNLIKKNGVSAEERVSDLKFDKIVGFKGVIMYLLVFGL